MIAAAVKHLLAAGVTGDALVAAIADMEAAQPKDAAAEKRRAWDRERKRAARASTGIPPESAESTDTAETTPSLSPSPSFPPDPQTNPAPMPTPVCVSRTRGGFPAPERVTAEQWEAFCKQRKKKLNERAYVLLCNKLAALARDGWPPGEMIDLATERGWETVFAPKDQRHDRQPASRNTVAFQLAMRDVDPHAPF